MAKGAPEVWKTEDFEKAHKELDGKIVRVLAKLKEEGLDFSVKEEDTSTIVLDLPGGGEERRTIVVTKVADAPELVERNIREANGQ